MKKSINVPSQNVTVIIQARLGSSRLPGKVLTDIEGKPMLWHIIQRVKQAKKVDKVIVATTDLKEDEKVVDVAKSCGVDFFQGSEHDVLDRYYQAAKTFGATTIVRVTGDCPVVDPVLLDRVVEFFLQGGYDHVSTAYPKATFPDGLDLWVFSFSALEKAWKEARLVSEREHVTPYMWSHPELFNIATFENSKDLSHMRWTVDEEKDLRFIKEIYKRLYSPEKVFLMKDIIVLLEKEPHLQEINGTITRDEGYAKSLQEDEKTN